MSRLEDDRRGLNEKGEKKGDNAYTKVYPENSFDVYGDEDNADSTCTHAFECIFCINMYSVKYRTMEWWKAAALMLAETVSLGVRTQPFPWPLPF